MNNDWVYTGNDLPRAYYNKLPKGENVLELRATDSEVDGVRTRYPILLYVSLRGMRRGGPTPYIYGCGCGLVGMLPMGRLSCQAAQ